MCVCLCYEYDNNNTKVYMQKLWHSCRTKNIYSLFIYKYLLIELFYVRLGNIIVTIRIQLDNNDLACI